LFDFLSPAWIQDLIQTYGLWVLFSVVLFECMGIPLPGEIALITTALYSGSTHRIGIVAVVAIAAGAGILGYNLAYLIGRSIGLRLIVRYGEGVGLNARRVKVGQYLFLRHGGKIVFLGRLVPFLRPFVALLAGADLMRWKTFLLMNSLGGICWASMVGFGAYFFGGEIKAFTGPAGILLLGGAVVLLIVGLVFFRHHEKELEERADAAIPG
jgi:membrane protein DedA with SNARE-associated domain